MKGDLRRWLRGAVIGVVAGVVAVAAVQLPLADTHENWTFDVRAATMLVLAMLCGARRGRLLLVAASILLAASPASAGWIIDEVVRGGAGGSTSRHRLFLEANRLKVVTTDGPGPTQAMVMNLDAQTITHIEYPARRYTTATAAEYAALMRQTARGMNEHASQMRGQMKEMEEQLKNLPPDQRRAIEAMMKQSQERGPGPSPRPADCLADNVEARGINRRITVAGYDAAGYQLFTNGKLDSEVYVAPAITAAREIDPEKLGRMVGEIVKALPQCPPRGQMFGADPMWKLMKDGYPVRSVGLDSGRVTEVVKAERRSLGADEFEPPAGFARTTLKEMMGGQ